MKIIRLVLLLLPILISTNSFSQVLLNTAGNTIKNSDYNFEYAIGEISISTLSSSDNTITQGLLQPNIKLLNPQCEIIRGTLLRFENPTRDRVRIAGQFDWITSYQVYATDGKLLRNSPFYNNYIDLSNLPAALYFIRLFPGCEGNFTVLKIIKQ
jgi:hypothetical protein